VIKTITATTNSLLASDSFLLPTFAAVFLGTAIIEPGRFNPIGTAILGLQLFGPQPMHTPSRGCSSNRTTSAA
jgi:hypothetical protein